MGRQEQWNWSWLGTLLAFLICGSPVLAGSHFDAFSDSGIEGPAYEQIVADLQQLEREFQGMASVTTYGESVAGVNLYAIKIRLPNKLPGGPQNRPAVVISGSTHGNEYLNIADRLPRHFLENHDTMPGLKTYLEMGGIVYLIPVINPDGYDRDRRSNLNGIDLNRDFDLLPVEESNFSQPETRSVARYLEQEFVAEGLNIQLTIDYHCCDGSLLYPWSYSRTSLPNEDLANHRQIATFMLNRIDSRYDHGSTGQVLGYYPRGTSKDYFFARYNALAFTFEGAYRRENRKFAEHVEFWNDIFGFLAAQGRSFRANRSRSAIATNDEPVDKNRAL